MNMTKTLSMKNKKEELLNAYSESSKQLNQLQQQQKVLFVISGVLFMTILF